MEIVGTLHRLVYDNSSRLSLLLQAVRSQSSLTALLLILRSVIVRMVV